MDPVLNELFAGVFARDELPVRPDANKFYVCNIAPSYHPGIHWVTIHKTSCGHLEYFDSLGRVDIHDDLLKFIGDNYKRVIVQTQETTSSLCGEYCIFYMSQRCRGSSIKEIADILDVSAEFSDSLVYEYVKSVYDFSLNQGFHSP